MVIGQGMASSQQGIALGRSASEVNAQALPGTEVSNLIESVSQFADEVNLAANELHALADRLYGALPEKIEDKKSGDAPVRAGGLGNVDYYLSQLQNEINRLRFGVNRVSNIA